MGAFVTKEVLDEVQVPCPCTGKPHEFDVVSILREFTGTQIANITSAMFATDRAAPEHEDQRTFIKADMGASNLVAMKIAVRGWTFVDDSGNEVPFDPELTNSLRSDIWRLVLEEVDKRTERAGSPLPGAREASVQPSAPTLLKGILTSPSAQPPYESSSSISSQD